jgi:hypothetical protein
MMPPVAVAVLIQQYNTNNLLLMEQDSGSGACPELQGSRGGASPPARIGKGRFARCGALAAALFALAVWPAAGQQTAGGSEVRLEAASGVRALAQAGEPLSLEGFIQAALLFSGASPGDSAAARQALAGHFAALRQAVGRSAGPRTRAEKALSYMHEAILKRYEEKQTRLDVLLRNGGFNCVSSAVLYAALLKSLDLRVWGVRTIDHAFCRVQAGSEAYDVETTSPFGFEPGRRTEFTDSFGKVTGFTYVPPSNYRDRRDIGERELLALILYNRAAFLTERGAYFEAAPVAVDAYALLGDTESRQRLVTTLHNLASSLAMAGRFRRRHGCLPGWEPCTPSCPSARCRRTSCTTGC